MADLDAIVHKSEDAAAKALCQKSCPYPNCKCPRLWRGQISRASGALDAIGFRELVEALMPFAERGRSVSVDEIRRAEAVIAKLDAGNADG